MIEAQAHIAALAPYVLAELKAPPGKRLISLAQNESCMPPSPKALAAAAEALSDSQLYPDPDWIDLRAAISEVHGIEVESILCGAGSMELIATLLRCYVGPGVGVVSSQYAYAFFRTATLAVGADYRWAAEQAFTVQIDAILDAAKAETRIVCLANPGNPTGTRIPDDEIRRLRAGLRNDILLMVDEAYGEFADDAGGDLFDLCGQGNTVVLRTFSKAYGLAGARAGWGVFPRRVAEQVRKLLNPNNISTASQAACAAAMRDQDYMHRVCRETAARRDRFRAGIQRLGLTVPPASTNFVLIEFSNNAAAQAASNALNAEGIVVRGMAGYDLPRCLRATIAEEADMDFTLSVLARHLERENP